MTQVPHLPRPSSSLYVGDLAPEVTEQALYDHFKHVGTIPSIRVLRDNLTGTSLGYAYVNFASQGEAEKALNELNYSRIRDRPCRIMYVNRDPTLRKTGVGNIIMRNLAKEIDYRGVTELCSKYGPILSCRILYDNATGESKGCAFVHFANDTGANDAVINLNGKIVRAENSPEEPGIQPLKVEHYQPQQILQQRALDTFTNVYIKHLKPDVSDEQLRNLFDSFGETISVRIMRHGDSESKGFAFCSYKDHTSAVKAIEDLHDREHELSVQGRNMYVQRAMKRSERQRYVRQAIRERRLQYAQYTNLYVKNLDDAVTSEKLYSVFSPYGEIRSAKVMKDPITGVSKGFGFVSFINADDAKRAVKELANRLILSSKPLFVTYAQTKEERRRQLEERQQRSRYQQMDPTFSGMPGHTGATQHGYAPQSAMPQPMYPFGTPGMFPTGAHGPLHGPRGGHTQQPQQMLHQNRAPQQQQQHIMNSNVGVMPGRGGHPGMGINVGPPHGRGGLMGNVTQGGPMQSMPPMMKHQMGGMPRVGSGPLPSAAPQSLAMYSTSIQGPTAQSIPHAPVSVVGQPAVRAVQKSTSGIDPSMLAQMQPEQARNFLGEKLYHHISRSHPEQAAKITGMLLEMDNSEILNLLDSTDLLEMKVEEAVDVLRTHNK